MFFWASSIMIKLGPLFSFTIIALFDLLIKLDSQIWSFFHVHKLLKFLSSRQTLFFNILNLWKCSLLAFKHWTYWNFPWSNLETTTNFQIRSFLPLFTTLFQNLAQFENKSSLFILVLLYFQIKLNSKIRSLVTCNYIWVIF